MKALIPESIAHSPDVLRKYLGKILSLQKKYQDSDVGELIRPILARIQFLEQQSQS